MESPSLSPETARAIMRLAALRREIRQLETEEQRLRQEVTVQLMPWPGSAFPLSVGTCEVRLTRRKGRVDYEAAVGVLNARNLLQGAPEEAAVSDQQACRALRQGIAELPMPPLTQIVLEGHCRQAIAWRPVIAAEWLESLCGNQALDNEAYARCFKDQKPVVPVLVVR